MIYLVEKFDTTKTTDYFFSGLITEQRNWLKKYPNVNNSCYGRNCETKYSLDIEYYKNMSSACFGPAPVGDCPWSYRFFEAIMCQSLPILGDNDEDIYSKNFSFFRDSEDHVYDIMAVKNNYKIFTLNHVLKNILIKNNI